MELIRQASLYFEELTLAFQVLTVTTGTNRGGEGQGGWRQESN